jgi:pilus assembly protein CpaD
MNKVTAFGKGLRPVALRLSVVSLAVLGLAACSRTYDGGRVVAFEEPTTIEERHPIIVDKKSEQIEIATARSSTGLNEFQRLKVQEFVGRWRHEGDGRLIVSAPSGTGNEGAAYRIVADIRELIDGADFPAGAVEYRPYHAGSGKPPVKLSYLRWVAEAPECGDFSKNLSENPRNVAYDNFGCASQHNLAAMIANPRDLVEPRDTWARPSERRDVIWRKFILGESTIAKKDAEEKAGSISDVGN